MERKRQNTIPEEKEDIEDMPMPIVSAMEHDEIAEEKSESGDSKEDIDGDSPNLEERLPPTPTSSCENDEMKKNDVSSEFKKKELQMPEYISYSNMLAVETSTPGVNLDLNDFQDSPREQELGTPFSPESMPNETQPADSQQTNESSISQPESVPIVTKNIKSFCIIC